MRHPGTRAGEGEGAGLRCGGRGEELAEARGPPWLTRGGLTRGHRTCCPETVCNLRVDAAVVSTVNRRGEEVRVKAT